METRRLTMAQALLEFLETSMSSGTASERRFFAGAWGIFGHGIIAGFGQALQQSPDFPYYLCRNEQAAVHIARPSPSRRTRLSTFACTVLDRPRRHQHDHRRGRRHHQSPAGAAAARRYLRAPQRRARAAATRIANTARTSP